MKQAIYTEHAPKVIGTYSQGVKIGNMVFLSGQIPLDPKTMQVNAGDFADRVAQVFKNLQAVVEAANGKLTDVVKLTIFLTDLSQFPVVNQVMTHYFQEPYPARTTIEVSALPKEVDIEIDAIMISTD